MADSKASDETSCAFLFKKSTKKFAGRKRKASDSDKGGVLQHMYGGFLLLCERHSVVETKTILA